MKIPQTRYAETADGTFIAFQTFGTGPIDILLIQGFFSNLDENWRIPEMVDFHERLGAFARVIAMDRRGVGLSDRLARDSSEPLESHVDDVVAVLEAVHADRVCVFATDWATALALLFAASHPDRVRAIAIHQPLPISRGRRHGIALDDWMDEMLPAPSRWGTEFAQADLDEWAPSVASDRAIVEAWGTYLRASASPGSARSVLRQHWETDARATYPSIQAPTLLIRRADTAMANDFAEIVDEAVSSIAGARAVELPGRDLVYWFGDRIALIAELEEFFTGARVTSGTRDRRGLATVLFTDIVGSTEQAARLGDAAWSDLLAAHHTSVRHALGTHRGTELDTAGDGFLALFDGPARAVRAACDARERVSELRLEIRAGVHTGEVEHVDGDVKGIAVHIGARVAGLAGASEILVSQTVKDLTAGSGLTFEDAGEHELKGVPDRWHLYRVVS
jgi:class 3 adenylate cyclase/pimeloyl-ACP methyl ester carboxylesterase